MNVWKNFLKYKRGFEIGGLNLLQTLLKWPSYSATMKLLVIGLEFSQVIRTKFLDR